MSEQSPPLELVPSLQALVAAQALDLPKLCVALETDGHGKTRVAQKHSVPVSDGVKLVRWEVPALAGLFRGNRTPPADINHYPPEYARHFYWIEKHFLTLCHAGKDPTDQQMEEIYSELRRRPDGRSLGLVHDFTWQVAALFLGTRVVSAAEFNAILGALVRSTRKWSVPPVSRNYAAYLRQTFSA